MKKIETIGVYCSSYEGLDEGYRKAATELGKQLAEHKITMVYGGGILGLMGDVSKAAMLHGGRVIGFMPNHLKELEDPNWAITELHMVDTMHTRKRLMLEHSDAFFILPGGFGTLDEVFEVITWAQLKLHDKLVIFINVNGYWDPLQNVLSNIFDHGFARSEHKNFFTFVTSVEEAFQALHDVPKPSMSDGTEWI